MVNGLGHIGLAVRNIEEFLTGFCAAFSLPTPSIRDVADRRLKVALIDLGNAKLEVIQDYSPDGVIARFVKEHGNGIHHFCMTCDDIAADVESLVGGGVQFIDPEPKTGVRGKRVVFVSPEVFDGMNVELSEP